MTLRPWLRLACVVAALAVVGAACASRSDGPRVERGTIDLTRVDLSRGPIELSGDWDFFWEELVAPGDPRPAPALMKVPGRWNGVRVDGRELGGQGYATYRLVIKGLSTSEPLALRLDGPTSASRIFANGREVGGAGRVAADPRDGVAVNQPTVLVDVDTASAAGTLELVVQISNYHHARAGLVGGAVVGRVADLRRSKALRLTLDAISIGALVLIGLYHLAFFVMRRRELAALPFAIFCGIVALRTSNWVIPAAGITWRGMWEVVYLCTFSAGAVLQIYLHALYPKEFPRWWVLLTSAVELCFCLVVIVFPPRIFMQTLAVHHVCLGVLSLYSLGATLVATWRRRPQIGYLLVGLSAYLFAGVNDMLYPFSVQLTGQNNLATFALLLMVFCQALLMAKRFSMAFGRSEELTQDLHRLDQASRRFVPAQMLDLMGRRSVTELSLGDLVAREMSILVLDIRSFTSLAEGMSSADTFAFLNSLLRRVTPHVRRHDGYIDNYMGDAFVALFPGRPEHALETALAISAEIDGYNDERRARGKTPVQIGIGLHHGPVVVGTIGDEVRMKGTVVSAAVDQANELESLTKVLGVTILASEELVAQLADRTAHRLRDLGMARLEGQQVSFVVHEVIPIAAAATEPPRAVGGSS